MAEVSLATALYAQELVKFVLGHHGIACRSAQEDFWNDVPRLFHPAVGRVVIAFARSSERDVLSETGERTMDMRSHEIFGVYCIHFRHLYFRNYGYSAESLFKYFAYILEQAVLLFLQGIGDTPSMVADAIANCLLHVDSGRFVMNGGLNELNDRARFMLATNPSLTEAYKFGHFAWWNV